jgi:hypothetical protein
MVCLWRGPVGTRLFYWRTVIRPMSGPAPFLHLYCKFKMNNISTWYLPCVSLFLRSSAYVQVCDFGRSSCSLSPVLCQRWSLWCSGAHRTVLVTAARRALIFIVFHGNGILPPTPVESYSRLILMEASVSPLANGVDVALGSDWMGMMIAECGEDISRTCLNTYIYVNFV